MARGEFELIERYFRRPAEAQRVHRKDVPLGIGDDAALLDVPAGWQLVAALDALVEGRHFPAGCEARSIGHRALAVNLSDLAAMGATPAWFLLSLTLPAADEDFLAGFTGGMMALGDAHGVALVGGDTTGGPLVAVVQALGLVPAGAALTRAGASPGDLVYVSGTPGDAAAGLRLLLDPASGASIGETHRDSLLQRFMFPAPRVALGQSLLGLASACIDVSDGLAADAGRLAAASGCGLQLDMEQLPLSPALQAFAGDAAARRMALTGGEDYELCFTIAPGRLPLFAAQLDNVKCQVTCIGSLVPGSGITVREQGRPVTLDLRGYDHFPAP
ncbi:MAG: thiamine-phosphate kinase [Pseudomonadota bacterium]|nr:thiamine-phosphate kinase [Pseudomonadota bacterium]